MKFIRKHKTLSILSLIFLIGFVFVTVAYGRYIRNIIYDFILETKAFYFDSGILGVNEKHYSIENWDGVNSYPLTIDLTNRKNSRRVTNTDIVYTVSVDCPTTVTCSLSKNGDTIHPEEDLDTFQVTVYPHQNFSEGDTVTVVVTVTSSTPYVKTLSASYTIGVEKSNFTYEIVDSSSSKYLTVNFVNSIAYYEVETAFGSYAVGDKINLEDFINLTPAEQANCFSAIVTLTYNPQVLEVDMTDLNYIHHLPTNYQEQTINGFQYVKQFSFKIPASSSTSVLFYKNDVSQNYTYPVVNQTSIVQVSVNKAD